MKLLMLVFVNPDKYVLLSASPAHDTDSTVVLLLVAAALVVDSSSKIDTA